MAAPKTQQAAVSFLDFVNSSPSPFHAVRTAKEQLSKAGFQEIKVNCSLPAIVSISNQLSLPRKKHPGRRPVCPVENITSLEMDQQLLRLRWARNGDPAILLPWSELIRTPRV